MVVLSREGLMFDSLLEDIIHPSPLEDILQDVEYYSYQEWWFENEVEFLRDSYPEDDYFISDVIEYLWDKVELMEG